MPRKFILHNKAKVDLEFVILNADFDVAFEDGFFSEEEQEEICSMVDSIKKMIPVDRTYVETKKSKFKGTFLVEEGWNAFCSAILESGFGQKMAKESLKVAIDAFATIAQCYVYECLSLYFNGQLEHIMVSLKPDSVLDVVVCEDVSSEWKRYPGKWQTWKKMNAKKDESKKKSRKHKSK